MYVSEYDVAVVQAQNNVVLLDPTRGRCEATLAGHTNRVKVTVI